MAAAASQAEVKGDGVTEQEQEKAVPGPRGDAPAAGGGQPQPGGPPLTPSSSSSGGSGNEWGEGGEEEEEELEESFDGVLTVEAVAGCLSNMSTSATGNELVYLDLFLPGQNLTDVSILCNYVYLQKLDLSYNKITGRCINASYVNLSNNQMGAMKDLSAHQALTKLILDYNNISEIKGLEKCRSLTHLSLAHNKISAITGLADLPLKTVCLGGNRIERVTGLENLQALQRLDLSCNKIQSLHGLGVHDLLETVDLENNQVAEVGEIKHLDHLPLLRVLNLLRNPVQERAEYWLSVNFILQSLTELDKKQVKIKEKVAAVNKYSPPPEVIAAEDHLTHIVYSMMQSQRIFDSTLPSPDVPYPMLVLTGPRACGKRELTHKICQDFMDFFGYGVSHTTRSQYPGEEDGTDYYFVSKEKFEDLVRQGKFIQTIKYSGDYYGLSREAIESVAREGLACCVHMELEGVRSLKNTYFEPRYILLIPMDKEQYEKRLMRRGLYSRSEVNVAVARVDTYVKMNQDLPGYFDTVINVDSEKGRYSPSLTAVSKFTQSPVSDEMPDSTTRNLSARVQAKLVVHKTQLEETSMQKRQLMAREALLGKTPVPCAQLFKR
nr:PREDICTED: leucine-rich repeat and guanylate kinase domain-containing protein [Latimeria chalumnae]|eukprot:XP_005997396.2 PREDICTED: leucine-rich repeat and guanylate kinase domain-containing protein [Latimeria chalumnae]